MEDSVFSFLGAPICSRIHLGQACLHRYGHCHLLVTSKVTIVQAHACLWSCLVACGALGGRHLSSPSGVSLVFQV